MNKTRWAQLSPLLDELLDLDPAARAQRLAEWRAGDATTADALDALLAQLSSNERAGFLERPAALAFGGMAGRAIGAYTVVRELGVGGMGSVWLAHRTDGRYEGSVAVKFLNLGLAAHGGAERFAREGSILARLAHPNIARLIDAGVAGDGTQPYLVLEFIDGERIDHYCEHHGLGVAARVRLFLDVLAAVAHAHNRLILHRDIKPSNILVTAAGEVKLLDFGIAKLMDDAATPAQATELTRAAGGAFTPMYAAPEQVQGGDVTTATDVYALGVLLYVLLAGKHPTLGTTTTPVEQMRTVLEAEPKRLSDVVAKGGAADAGKRARELRGDLDNIVAKALKKLPAERYATASDLADDLRRYLADEPVAARPDALAYRTAKFIRRHKLGVAAGGTVALALAGGIGVALWQAQEAHRQRVQAEGLIEFMLGDLRKKLQPVGRLDVLDAVGEKTLAYYAAQDAGQLDADSLGRRSRALHLIGEIHDKRGRLDEALAAFQGAANVTGELLARAPRNGQRVFEHAQSVYWVGYVARRRGQMQQAEASFRRYLELAQQLVAIDPSNLDWRLETSYAGYNLGVVYLDDSRPADALKALSDTRVALSSMVGARPELSFDLANTDGWIAKAHEARGDFGAAIESQRTKVAALQKVPGAATNRGVQERLANATHELGRLELYLGRAESARASAGDALKQHDKLLALDPSNLSWLAETCFARLASAEAELLAGDRGLAHNHLERVAADLSRLKQSDKLHSKRLMLLGGRLLALRAAAALATAAPLAVEPLETFVAEGGAGAVRDKPLDAEQRIVLSTVELALGDLLARAGRADAAALRWGAAADRLRPSQQSDNARALTLLARAEARIGHADEAQALAQRIEASKYRHPDYAVLLQELARKSWSGQQPHSSSR